MSEIGERAEKLWREQTEIIRRNKELLALQAKHYAEIILDVFGTSNEQYCVSTVIVVYIVTAGPSHLDCSVQFFDIDGKTNKTVYSNVNNEKVMAAMNNVNACKFENYTIFKNIYNVLVTDPQVTKYLEVTSDEDGRIVIKMRPEEDVTLNETICENEESE